MVDAYKIGMFCIEKFVIQRCSLWKRGEFLHPVHHNFGSLYVGRRNLDNGDPKDCVRQHTISCGILLSGYEI